MNRVIMVLFRQSFGDAERFRSLRESPLRRFVLQAMRERLSAVGVSGVIGGNLDGDFSRRVDGLSTAGTSTLSSRIATNSDRARRVSADDEAVSSSL